MLIDTNASVSGKAGPPASLTPELDQLLSTLKLHIGQRIDANVTRVTELAESERQLLLAMRGADKPSPGQKTLIAVLSDPGTKLVELSIRNHPVATLTQLPLARDSSVQILVTPRGLVLLPPATSTPSPPPQGSSSSPAQPAGLPMMASTPITSSSKAQGQQTPQLAVTSVKVSQAVGAALQEQPTKTAASSLQNPLSLGGLADTKSPNIGAAGVNFGPAQKTLLANAMSQTLPQAQPLKTLLTAAEAINRLATNDTTKSISPVVAELRTLLSKVSLHTLDVTHTIKPDALRQAMNTSGLFYERRLLTENSQVQDRNTAALSERDIKGLLIQLTQWTAGQPPITGASGAQSSSDTLAQLMMSLARLLSPRSVAKHAPAERQLSLAVKELAERSLAQVQLQQLRTLSSRIPEASTPGQWHLDIPLKLPDAYGNLYIQLFEPRSAAEEKKPGNQRRSRNSRDKRWKVFLELELDELGTLAAEISVQEKNVEAILWSGNSDLRQRVHNELESLRDDLQGQGVVVTDLRCSNNAPPPQKIRLDYALVDIKT